MRRSSALLVAAAGLGVAIGLAAGPGVADRAAVAMAQAPAAGPSPSAPAPADRGPASPPFDLTDPARIEAGRQQFKLTCAVAYCHGPEGRIGGGAPSLRGRKVGEPESIYNTIANGRRRMPRWRSALPPEKIWTLVAYVMSLEKEPTD